MYNFLWSDLFDWYFEFSKNLIEDESTKHETQSVLLNVFTESLKLLNPAMPHVTEEIWSTFNNNLLIDNDWPTKIAVNETGYHEVDELKNIITYAKNNQVEVISLTSNEKSFISTNSNLSITLPIHQEAYQNSLAPMTSTTMQLVIGDLIGLRNRMIDL